MIRRRQFITLLGGATVAWPLPAHGQQGGEVRRIGVLMGYAESNAEGQAFVAAFRDGILKLGWIEGRNRPARIEW
jgi:putative ABC transport system substrate-binding protein